MKGKISMLIKSKFNEYVNAEHAIAMKETVTRLAKYLGTYGPWIQAGEYLFKADAIESIFAGGKSVDVKIENQVFSIACEDEAKLEAILDKIEKGFCGAVFNM